MRDTGQRNGKPCILLVADDAALRTMLRYNLETQRYLVEEAEDGPRALARIAEVLPDLVILDWMLPVSSGIEICREVRRGWYPRDVPILVISARTTEQDVVCGLDAGAT